MAKYNRVTEWMEASISEKNRSFLQAFADGVAKDRNVTIQEGDIVRWSLKSSGKMGLAVFRPEQAAKRKAPTKAEETAPAKAEETAPAKADPASEILAYVKEGYDVETIADLLGLKISTVESVINHAKAQNKAPAKKKARK